MRVSNPVTLIELEPQEVKKLYALLHEADAYEAARKWTYGGFSGETLESFRQALYAHLQSRL